MAVVTLKVLVVLAIRSILDFSPFSSAVGVGELSNGLDAVSFPPVEQTISKVSQQRRQKREGGRKTGRKQVEKGLHKPQCCGTSGQKIQNVLATKSRISSPENIAYASDEREG